MSDEDRARRLRLPPRVRALVVVLVFVIYCVAYVYFYPKAGEIVAIFSIVPAGVAGWLYGWWIGVVAGVVMAPLDLFLYTVGGSLPEALAAMRRGFVGHIFVAGLSALIGYFSDLLRRVRFQAEALEQKRQQLLAEIERRREVEKRLTEASAVAIAASEAKSAFLANMSHELRTPLNAIIGYAELLQDMAGDGGHHDMVDDLNKIQTAGRHLLAIIGELLDLSKIEAGRMELHLAHLDLTRLLEEIAVTARPLVEKGGNSLNLRVAPEVKEVVADPTKIRQILLNLISNAAKFTNQGTITVAVKKASSSDAPEPRFTLSVADTGVGMSREQVQRLFQPFVQVHGQYPYRPGGTGLGLVISRKLCQLMGGDMQIESEVGRGTTCTVTLPLRVAPRAMPSQPPIN